MTLGFNREAVARTIISWFTDPDRARTAVAGIPPAAAAPRWWSSVAREAAASVCRDFRRHPAGLGARVLGGYALAVLVSASFVPLWLLYRYAEDSLSSSGLLLGAVRHALPAVSFGWQLIVEPLVIGLVIAWFSRRHELAVCCGLLVLLTAITEAVRLGKGPIGPAALLPVLGRSAALPRGFGGCHSGPIRAAPADGRRRHGCATLITMQMIQIFGVKNSAATRAAERFFKERRAPIQFVDLKKKPFSPGEIKRFIDRFGLNGLVDTESSAYVNAGLKYLKMTPPELLERVDRDPLLLRLPMVRSGNRLSVGKDETAWQGMLADLPR